MTPSAINQRRADDGTAETARSAAQGAPVLVRTEPLYEQIYDVLWQRILALEIAPGGRVRDVEWAEKLNVSRTPVREALRKLQKDGVLEPTGHGRYVLKRIGAAELRSLYRCRAVLEALAVRDLQGHISSGDVAGVEAIVQRTAACLAEGDFQTAYRLNTGFHDELLRSVPNLHVQMLLATLKRLILYARSSLRVTSGGNDALFGMYADHLQCSQDRHVEILAAVSAGKFDEAAELMEQHLFETAEHMAVILAKAGAAPVPPRSAAD